MNKANLLRSVAITIAMLVLTNTVNASDAPTKTKSTKSAPTNKSTKAAKPAPEPQYSEDDDVAPDVKQGSSIEYKCELGNVLTIYKNPDDESHVALRWKKNLYRLRKIETTTGASRFENKKLGFVWIGIPAKGMLLDSRKGQQLANECKTTEPALAEGQTNTSTK